MSAGLWQVLVTGTIRSKQTQTRILIFTAATSSKSAVDKVVAGYHWANLDLKTIQATRMSVDVYQCPTTTGLILKKR